MLSLFSENMVGKGGHAEVYRGTLVDGRIVAVKRLTKDLSEEIKEQDFLIELGIVAHVCHPNTTPLVGFCIEEGLHLIFEFSSRGSLATLLYGICFIYKSNSVVFLSLHCGKEIL